MDVDAFVKTGWQDHGDAPQDVANRLADACQQIEASEQVAPFVRLLVHVYGEHLGQWQQGADLVAYRLKVSGRGLAERVDSPMDVAAAFDIGGQQPIEDVLWLLAGRRMV